MKIQFENKEITLKQEPYIDGPAGETPIYKAQASDAEGNEYFVTWAAVEGWENIEDESEMCDWDHPTGLMLVK
ncbi:hypothetical protein JJQ72_06350 [Paenibacillus sp. F411]|uniref:hypothetical protein n=1 Tax=Paenibacillus sp. F411 TaxID=2820239 RepID=UPI001AAFEE49|nr:hypothetical protein [Paenibacillus sp. F411]MBO2943598.1 hypothetical protein [Paenibacillus sp. F411]